MTPSEAPQPAPSLVPAPPVAPPNRPSYVPQRRTLGLILALIAVFGLGWKLGRNSTPNSSNQWVRESSEGEGGAAVRKRTPSQAIDLNRANTNELRQLPGIGPTLAEGIVRHRELHGDFGRVDELRKVHGIGPATLEKIKPWLFIDEAEAPPDLLTRRTSAKPEMKSPPTSSGSGGKKAPLTEPIAINSAEVDDLERLPGIGPVFAQRIMEERAKAPFRKPEDLRRISGIGPKRLEQLRPWIRFDDD